MNVFVIGAAGTWNSGVTLSFAWYAGTTRIHGASGKTLKLTSSLRGKRIKVVVTGTKPAYLRVSKASAATSPVR